MDYLLSKDSNTLLSTNSIAKMRKVATQETWEYVGRYLERECMFLITLDHLA